MTLGDKNHETLYYFTFPSLPLNPALNSLPQDPIFENVQLLFSSLNA